MSDWIATHELLVRLIFFFGILSVMAIWEVVRPRRRLTVSKLLRWANNLGLVLINSVALRLLFPAAAAGMSAYADAHSWGVLNRHELPFWMAVTVSIIVLDLVIYLQHVMVHALPLLWRLHRVHHADPDIDVTTGARFHPIEIILSMLIKFAAIVVLGPPVVAVILFEVLLNATAMFNHSNVRLPASLDRVLRTMVVTPDMHRVHHSVEADEANSNFGFNLPWWDRLFGTYRDQPRAGHEKMPIGIHGFGAPRDVSWIPGMLWLPFRRKVGNNVIGKPERDGKDAQ